MKPPDYENKARFLVHKTSFLKVLGYLRKNNGISIWKLVSFAAAEWLNRVCRECAFFRNSANSHQPSLAWKIRLENQGKSEEIWGAPLHLQNEQWMFGGSQRVYHKHPYWLCHLHSLSLTNKRIPKDRCYIRYVGSVFNIYWKPHNSYIESNNQSIFPLPPTRRSL